jgi:hypothetical protein
MMVMSPDNCDENVADCVLSQVGQSNRSALKVGSSGGRRSKTKTVIRAAKTPSENALNRSGVAARSTAASFTLCYRRFGRREFTVPSISVGTTGSPAWTNPAEYAVDGDGVNVQTFRFISPPKPTGRS